MVARSGRALATALALFVSWSTTRAHAQDEPWLDSIYEVRTVARILASANVQGQLLDPVCDDGELLEPADEGLFTYALVRAAHAADHPLVIDAGGLLAPAGVMRFAAETDAGVLADMAQALGYRALTFGENELGSPREDMIAVAGELRARRIPMIASNLRCTGSAVPLCDQLVDASDGISMHTVLETQVAVLAFLEEGSLDRVAPDLSDGLSIESVDDAMARDVREARRLGAELVVAIVTTEVDRSLEIVDALDPEERPDLVILADAGEHLFSVRPTSAQTAMVAPPSGDAAEIIVRDEHDLRVPRSIASQPLRMRGISTGEPVLDLADEIGAEYCDTWGRALPGGHLSRTMTAADVAMLAAEIARERADADVAVLNLDAIDDSWEPAHEDALTDSDVYVALQYDEPLVVADVSRAWIEGLAHHAAERELITPGLDTNGGIRVGSRELVTRAHYRVVTLRFLAEGGDGALLGLDPHDTPAWRPLGDTTIRSVVDEALQARSERDPRDVREHPEDMPQWLVTGSLDGTFAGSSISNPGAPSMMYTSASLNNRQSTVSLGVEVNAGVAATAPDWTWENTLVARYRAQWSPVTMATQSPWSTALDQIQFRTTGTWRGFHTATRSHDWYVPDLYGEAFVESEFVQPVSRNFHWLLVRPQLGLRFTLVPELDVKLDVGFQTQPLAAGLVDAVGRREDTIDGGLGGVVTLRPWDLIRDGDRHTTLSGVVDFFWADPFARSLWQLRGQLDAQIDLAGPLSLMLGVRLYLQQDGGARPLGAAVDATAGFRISGLGRVTGP